MRIKNWFLCNNQYFQKSIFLPKDCQIIMSIIIITGNHKTQIWGFKDISLFKSVICWSWTLVMVFKDTLITIRDDIPVTVERDDDCDYLLLSSWRELLREELRTERSRIVEKMSLRMNGVYLWVATLFLVAKVLLLIWMFATIQSVMVGMATSGTKQTSLSLFLSLSITERLQMKKAHLRRYDDPKVCCSKMNKK